LNLIAALPTVLLAAGLPSDITRFRPVFRRIPGKRAVSATRLDLSGVQKLNGADLAHVV